MAWTKEKAREYARELRQWCRENNWCVECHKERCIPGKRYCYDCAEKSRIRSISRTPEKRAKDNEAARKRYWELKEQGICTRCRKRPSNGKALCTFCLAVDSIKANSRRRDQGIMPRYLMGDGYHCALCGKDTEKPGDKLCTTCLERNRERAETMRKHTNPSAHWWNRDNTAAFSRGEKNNEEKRTDGNS